LKADGSVDATNYLSTASAGSTYLPLAGGILTGGLTGTSFVKSGGLATEFLKADGSVDARSFLTTSVASSSYLPLSGGILSGTLNGTNAILSSDITATAFKKSLAFLLNF